MASTSTTRDTSIRTYRAKRDFAITAEPAPGKTASANATRRSSWCRSTRRIAPACTGTSAWSMTACCGAGRCARGRRSIPPTSASPRMSRTTRSTTPISRAPSRTASTAPARWRPGIAAPGNRWTIPTQGMRKGELTFVLHGKRLNGRFHLVRLKPQPGSAARQDNWLLFKGHDEAERAGADAPDDRTGTPPASRKADARSHARKCSRREGRRCAPNCRKRQAAALALRRRRRAARRQRLDQRDQVRRLSPARAGSTTARCAWSPAMASTGPTGCPPWPSGGGAECRDGAGGRRTGRAREGRRVQLPRAAGGAVGRQGRHAVFLVVRSAASRRLGPARLRAAGSQARAPRRQRLARHAALQRPPHRRRRRHAARGLPA